LDHRGGGLPKVNMTSGFELLQIARASL
jgi:hypothetical protein